MKTLKFVKDPGYLYDLFFLFTLYFNQNTFLSKQVNQNKTAEDTEHFNQMLNAIGEIPEELRVFFQLKGDSRCFITTHYYRNRIDSILSGAGLDSVRDSLQDYNAVISNVLHYYFEQDADEIPLESPEFLRAIGKKIRDSEYDVALKNSLYEFFLDPIHTTQILYNELSQKDFFLSKLYIEKDPLITKIQGEIDINNLTEKTLKIKSSYADLSSFNEIIISICTVNKNCIDIFLSKRVALVLLGTDYEDFADYLNTREMTPALAQFGIALAEENRIQMLEMILERGEATVAEVKQKMNLSHTNTYYHITLLTNANLLATRNQGRTVYYSINHDYFKDICTVLSKFKKKEGETT